MAILRLAIRLEMLALMVGAYAAGFHHRWEAWVLFGWLAFRGAYHLGIGAWAYRDVMSRPWPRVRPLDDWDD
jgi:hypothetical protein